MIQQGNQLALKSQSNINPSTPVESTFKFNKISESLVFPEQMTKKVFDKVTNTSIQIIKDKDIITKIEKSEIVTSFRVDNEVENILDSINANMNKQPKRLRTFSESMTTKEVLEINFSYKDCKDNIPSSEMSNFAMCSFRRGKHNEVIKEEDYFNDNKSDKNNDEGNKSQLGLIKFKSDQDMINDSNNICFRVTPKYKEKILQNTKELNELDFSLNEIKKQKINNVILSPRGSNKEKHKERKRNKPLNESNQYNNSNNCLQKNQSANSTSVHSNYIDEGRLNKTFSNLEQIGKGGFGLVIKAKHIIDENFYAIKIIKLKVDKYRTLMSHPVIKEVKTMIKLNHKNVVRYTTCWFQMKLDGIETIIDDNKSLFISEGDTSRSLSMLVKSFNIKKKTKNGNPKRLQSNNDISEERSNVKTNTSLSIEFKDKNRDKTPQITAKLPINVWEDSDAISEVQESVHEDYTVSMKKSYIMLSSTEKNHTDNECAYINQGLKIWEDDEESIKDDKVKEQEQTKKHSNLNLSWMDNSEISKNKKVESFRLNLNPKMTIYFFMQMEFCNGLPLNLYLESHKEVGISRQQIFSFLKQILVGVNHMHKNRVIHRDLK